MAVKYLCVLREGPTVSWDAAVGSKPTGKSVVLAPALQCRMVNIEAENVAEAQEACRGAYPGSVTTVPLVAVSTELKES